MELAGKVALITGGRRMGKALASALASRGAHVALSYGTSRAEAEDAAAAVTRLGTRAIVIQADLTSAEACASMTRQVEERLGGLDVLVNMASAYVKQPLEALTAADWDRALAVDLRGAFLCSHAAATIMRKGGGGRIVNFSDWVARSGRPRYRGYLAYYVAKAGVIALSEALALELAPDRILVNTVAPGPILAPASISKEERKAVEEATPLGRWGGEEELVKAVLSLVESDFITGETIRVDGGRHLK
jgi:NAD(P)-dependent dehydrogenase (short-subunit alcohol dehydrogenase family)